MAKPDSKRAVVTGAGGFIGHHLVKRLKDHGFWVRGVDIKKPAFESSRADEFVIADLREPSNCRRVVEGVEEVYDLAADMGGMGFISKADCEVLRNNALINIHMAYTAATTLTVLVDRVTGALLVEAPEHASPQVGQVLAQFVLLAGKE